jgi:hypothetical protein
LTLLIILIKHRQTGRIQNKFCEDSTMTVAPNVMMITCFPESLHIKKYIFTIWTWAIINIKMSKASHFSSKTLSKLRRSALFFYFDSTKWNILYAKIILRIFWIWCTNPMWIIRFIKSQKLRYQYETTPSESQNCL